MGEAKLTTAREALLAELLEDVDSLLARFEAIDQNLNDRINQATAEASEKAFFDASMKLKRFSEDLEIKIDAATQAAKTSPENKKENRPTLSSTNLFQITAAAFMGSLVAGVLLISFLNL